jgi:hypothetical protein
MSLSMSPQKYKPFHTNSLPLPPLPCLANSYWSFRTLFKSPLFCDVFFTSSLEPAFQVMVHGPAAHTWELVKDADWGPTPALPNPNLLCNNSPTWILNVNYMHTDVQEAAWGHLPSPSRLHSSQRAQWCPQTKVPGTWQASPSFAHLLY